MAYEFKNLTNPQNTDSGIGEYLLVAPVSAFAANGIKSPVAPFAAAGDEVTIRTPHVFLDEEGGFMKITLAPDKNNYSAPASGDKGFVKLSPSATGLIPGSYAAQHEAIKNLLNKPLIVLVRDATCSANLYYQIGNECVPAYISGGFETGTTAEGNKGYTVTFEAKTGYVLLYQTSTPPPVLDDTP